MVAVIRLINRIATSCVTFLTVSCLQASNAAAQTPADRLAVLRMAFDETMKDPDYLTEAAKVQMEIDPLSAGQIDNLLATAYSAPKAIVQQATELIEPAGAHR